MVKQYIPTSLNEALKNLAQDDCYIMAGGTDLMVQKHRVSNTAPTFDRPILYLTHVDELHYLKEDENGLHVGSNMTMNELINSDLTPKILIKDLMEIASPQIRNVATLTGNVCNASPAGDSVCMLYALDARVVLISLKGERTLKISDFIKGVRKTAREKDELVKEILIPHHDYSYTYWKKVGSRKAETISKVTMAGTYLIKDHKLMDLTVAFGSVGITVKRDREIENRFIGLPVKDIEIDDLVNEYSLIVTPIDDQRSTAKYRHIVAMNILKDFLKHLKNEDVM